MKSENINLCEPVFSRPVSLVSILRTEWKWWVPASILVFFLASILMSGFPQGLLPNIAFPYVYQGDGMFHSWMTKRVIEGWIFDNPRSGYPFGSNFLDYPGSDGASHLIHKIIGTAFGSYEAAINLYYLLGFVAAFIASFAVSRAIGLSLPFSLAAAIVFSFFPFHFTRLAHLFYTWYFTAPLFFYAGFVVFYANTKQLFMRKGIYLFLLLLTGFVILASFGVYYALFGVIILATCGFAGSIRNRNFCSVRLAAIAIAMVVTGVVLNIAPNVINKKIEGKNLEVAVRNPIEAEFYGFKLMQLVLPRAGHRIEQLSKITNQYNTTYLLNNENSTSSLGAIGATGIVILFLVMLSHLAGMQIDSRLALLAIIVFVLFMFGTIGGLGAVFSAVISPSIRGWNRISIFIGFGAVTAFFLSLQMVIARLTSTVPLKASLVLGSAIALFGLFDQTSTVCQPCIAQTRQAYELDRKLVTQIEHTVPANSAIYQLPYLPFPEVPDAHRLGTYDLVAGFIHSSSLRWSYAGMKGRDGDLFYRALAQEPLEKQVEVVKRLGFAGIYIDRRGYKDNASELIESLSVLLKSPPVLQRDDGEVVFFRLNSSQEIRFDGMSSKQIMQKAGYFADKLGARYQATFEDGIDFTKQGWPDFVADAKGFSVQEAWGRWSDQNVAPFVQLDFFKPIPHRSTLVLKIVPFGPNATQDLVIKIGDKEYRVKIPASTDEINLPFDTDGKNVQKIEIFPPHPISPQEIGMNNTDARRLGVGFVHLRFTQ